MRALVQRFLRSIFGSGKQQKAYPDSLVRESIERAAEKTDPWIRAVTGYKKQLRPAVIRSLDHVAELADNLASPIEVDFSKNGSNAALAAFFVSHAEMLDFFRTSPSLAAFLREHNPPPERITALLVMDKSEGVVFGAEMSGDVIMYDVPQTTLNFQGHRLLEPAAEEAETRRLLMRRAFDHLLNLAHRKIGDAKRERSDLEKRRALYRSELSVLQKGKKSDSESEADDLLRKILELEEELKRLDAQYKELGSEDRVLDAFLRIVIDVLSCPEEHLWDTQQCLILDERGIKHLEPADNGCEITLHELFNFEGRHWVMALVTIPVEQLQNISSPLH